MSYNFYFELCGLVEHWINITQFYFYLVMRNGDITRPCLKLGPTLNSLWKWVIPESFTNPKHDLKTKTEDSSKQKKRK
jgi:hypothetical protein